MKNILLHATRSGYHNIASGFVASAAMLTACLAGSMPASAQEVVVLAPPAARYEAPPPPRMGYAWQRGYWAWQHGRYIWVQGQWIRPVSDAPLPAPAPVSTVMKLSTDALFPFDRGDVSDILPGGRAQIRKIADQLRAMRIGRLEVRGYTDRLGSSTYNLGLSQRRADAVKALLVQQGIPANRIDARGVGEQDSITQCSDRQPHDGLVACLQPDRRVEIVTFARTDDRPLPPPSANAMVRPPMYGQQ
jgi:OOP family OmpA-OmpF porin